MHPIAIKVIIDMLSNELISNNYLPDRADINSDTSIKYVYYGNVILIVLIVYSSGILLYVLADSMELNVC